MPPTSQQEAELEAQLGLEPKHSSEMQGPNQDPDHHANIHQENVFQFTFCFQT